MQFFQVSSDFIYSPLLNRVENKFGLAGIGFYFKAVAMIKLMDGSAPKINLLSLRNTGLRWVEAEDILDNYDLFEKDHRGNYILRGNSPENGLVEARSHKSSRTGATGAGTPAGAEAPGSAGTEAGTAAGAEASAGASAEAGSAQVLVDPLKTIKEETIKREINAEEAFLRFMNNQCPHLLNFEEPLTFDQLKTLRQAFSEAEIKSVLKDMNNKVGLEYKFRSCYDTARNWLEARARNI